VERTPGMQWVPETVRTGPWLGLYEELSARDPASLAAAELEALAVAAGFQDVRTGTVTVTWRFALPELATRWLREVAPPISGLLDGQSPGVQQRVWAKVTAAWAPFATADARVRLDNQAIWVTGTPSAPRG
jgi:hypothetical protein